jgi:hypothetical protein
MNNLYPQNTIRPPIISNHSFNGKRNAHMVTAPIINKIKPKSSISPGFLQQRFFFFIFPHPITTA